MTIEQALRGITNYPIPRNTLELAEIISGLDLSDYVDQETLSSIGYLKAERQVISFLLIAPTSISEQGVSFSVSADEKAELRKRLSTLNSAIDAAEIAKGEVPKQRRPSVAFDAY